MSTARPEPKSGQGELNDQENLQAMRQRILHRQAILSNLPQMPTETRPKGERDFLGRETQGQVNVVQVGECYELQSPLQAAGNYH